MAPGAEAHAAGPLSDSEALASLNSSPQGLSDTEAQRRRREYGPNRIESVRGESPWRRLARGFVHLFAVILWVAAALAFFAEWVAPGQGMAKVGGAIVVVIVVSAVFSFWQESRAEKTLAALRRLLPQYAEVMRDGKVARLSAEELVPGDVVLLEAGDHVSADCRLVEAFGVRVNNSVITGESLPQDREAGPCEAEIPQHARNVVLAGTSVMSGRARAVVFATGMQTEFGKMAYLAQARGLTTSPLQDELTYLSRWIAGLAVVIGVSFFAIGSLTGVPRWDAFIFAIGIIVAMVPEGLLPTLTLALVLATQRMAKRNVLIRHLPSIGTLGATTVICTDKTGTLTQNRMAVREVILGDQKYAHDQLRHERDLPTKYHAFFLVAGLCHNVEEGQGGAHLGDPMEIALLEMASSVLPRHPRPRRVYELPFDARRMRMATVHTTEAGDHVLYCKGAPESVMPLCEHLLVDGEVRPFTSELRRRMQTAQDAMAAQGLRVLAFAYRPLDHAWDKNGLESDLVCAGLVGLRDPPRPEVPGAIQKCHEAGVRVIMTTGDHPHTALAIAREVGLVGPANAHVVTGEELRHLSDSQLGVTLESPGVIFARVGPDQKLRIVEALRRKQHVVAVTGDGVNDAPALKNADVGIAMGQMGTDVAKEASDVVLLDDNFATIVNAIEEGRAIFDNIRKFLTYILTHNVPEVVPYLAFWLLPIPLALTPIQILSIDMGTDSLTALGLGVEPPDRQVMQRPPRLRHERLFTWSLACRAYLFLGVIEAAAALAAFFFVLRKGGWSWGERSTLNDPTYIAATTACLSAIIVMQIVNVFLCRGANRSVLSTWRLRNPLLYGGVLLEVTSIALIAYTAWGNAIFGTAPIPLDVWIFILPFAAALLVVEELRKTAARWVRRETRPTASAP
jgi:sodium/potassium-transporting ATPase subunit alpha